MKLQITLGTRGFILLRDVFLGKHYRDYIKLFSKDRQELYDCQAACSVFLAFRALNMTHIYISMTSNLVFWTNQKQNQSRLDACSPQIKTRVPFACLCLEILSVLVILYLPLFDLNNFELHFFFSFFHFRERLEHRSSLLQLRVSVSLKLTLSCHP